MAANTLPERHPGLPRGERAQLAGERSKAWPGYQGPAKAAGEVVRMAAQEQSLGGEEEVAARCRGAAAAVRRRLTGRTGDCKGGGGRKASTNDADACV